MKKRASCLFLIFNRPDETEKVFESIRRAKPKKLYIAGDGPRENREGESEKVAKTREIINKIDWACEAKFLFRNQNLGCKIAVSSAINWFFEHEDEGIIIEDDCLPNHSFFLFCEELLEKYRHDTRIMAISGNNFQHKYNNTQYSYCFSRYPHIWGWATWKRAWQHWDGELSSWPEVKEKKILDHIFYGNKKLIDFWKDIFDKCYAGKVDTWDYQWTYSCWLQNGLTILPKKNIVSNIGFSTDATHTVDNNDQHANLPVHEIIFPLQHPFYLVKDAVSDICIELDLLKKTNSNHFYRFLKNKFNFFPY